MAINKPASNSAPADSVSNTDFESWSKDLVSAVGLQDINVDVDAAATIGATSVAKSAAISENVTGDTGSLSEVTFNAGLQAHSADAANGITAGTNLIDVASDSGLSGIATTTASASASTSKGNATGYATLGDAAGISDLDLLKVGGELTALGKSVSTINGSAETVVGSASAAGKLSGSMEGFEGSRMTVSSDANLQGLTSLTNTASAAGTSGGNSTAEATANTIQGADLDGLKVGGTASLAGQASFGNTSNASNVVGNSVSLSDLTTAQGLVASTMGLDPNGALASGEKGINVSSDASITGLSSITSKAIADTTAGNADADSHGGNIDGGQLADVLIGGIGSITGQASFNSAASASNVTKGNSNGFSTADSSVVSVDGLEANELVKVSSDATLKGLSSINLAATAESTGATAATTVSDAAFGAGILSGASLHSVEIGGNGNELGQVSLTGASTANNVTGTAEATGDLADAYGLAADATVIKSDATLQGISAIQMAANAATNSGNSSSDIQAGDIAGSMSVSIDVGGKANINGKASFVSKAAAESVDGNSSAGGDLQSISGQLSLGHLNVSSDAKITGQATVNSASSAGTTSGNATAEANSFRGSQQGVVGTHLNDTDIGGGAEISGLAQFNFEADASNVNGGNTMAAAAAGRGFGLRSLDLGVKSDSGLNGTSIGSVKADSSSTAGNSTATAGEGDIAVGVALGKEVNGSPVGGLEVGGISNLTAAAQLDAVAVADTVGGSATANAGTTQIITSGDPYFGFNTSELPFGVTGLDATKIHVASDSTLTAKSFGNLDATANSIAGLATARAGGPNAQITGISDGLIFEAGGVGTIAALAQGTADATASSVTGSAVANADLAAMGIDNLSMNTSSDGLLSSTAKLVGTATAESTNATQARADLTLDATGIQDSDLTTGGIGSLSVTASITGSSSAQGVDSLADASANLTAMGIDHQFFKSASDGTLAGMGVINADVSATSTSDTAHADGTFDATGVTGLLMDVGGITTLKGQVQVKATMDAESVSNTATAISGPSTLMGLDSIHLIGDSNGSLLGTASGIFDTNAISIGGNANASASQVLRGINTLDLNLGGNGGINAIVNDTNFVSAHSVSGNATAVASVDAIGLQGGHIHIAGNATILANVGVESKADAHTIS